MKYPDGFLKLKSGPSPLGKSGKRALDEVGSPFLTKRAGGTVTRKKGDFTETRTSGGKPVLTAWTRTGDSLWNAYTEIRGTGETNARYTKILRMPRNGELGPSMTLARMPYIGDGLLLSMSNDGNDVGPDTALHHLISHWPTLLVANAAIKQRLSGEAESEGTSVSYLDSILITGLIPYFHDFGLHATGWDDETKRYRYGFSFKYYADGTDKQTALDSRIPMYFAGNTGDFTMVQANIPYYPDRSHPGGKMFVIGPGRLQQLVFVAELALGDIPDDPNGAPLMPYFANSTDHGETWTAAEAAFLQPYLYLHPAKAEVPADPPNTSFSPAMRAHLDNQQLNRMQDNHLNVYLGEGKSMLVIPNGVTEEGHATTCAMAFLGENGAGYTRVAWPADEWVSTSSLLGEPYDPKTDNYVDIFRQLKDFYSANFAFGVGCMYLPIRIAGVWKFLVTYNFGANWTTKDYPERPEGLDGKETFPAMTGTVVAPYIDEDQPGEIVFAMQSLSGPGRIDLLRTDGLFSAFKKTAGALRYKGELKTPPGSLIFQLADFNQHFTYFGGEGHIYPAFPEEFGKP